jgi:ankyrin repeat protein
VNRAKVKLIKKTVSSGKISSFIGKVDADLITYTDIFGFNLLLESAKRNKLDVMKWFLSQGFDPNHQANGGQNAIMWAFHHGNAEMIRTLIEYGADLNLQVEYEDKEYHAEIITRHWLNNNKADMLELLNQYRYLMNPACEEAFKVARLETLFNKQVL